MNNIPRHLPPARRMTPATSAPRANGGGYGVPDGENLPRHKLRQLRAINAIIANAQNVDQFPSAFEALPRPSRIMRPAGVTAAINAGITSAAISVKWPQSCYVIGMAFGTIENSTAALGAMSVAIKIAGSFDVATDGAGSAFIHVGSLLGSNGIALGAYFPFIRWADQSTNWQIQIKNESAGTTITPVVQFLVVDPRDLPDYDDC